MEKKKKKNMMDVRGICMSIEHTLSEIPVCNFRNWVRYFAGNFFDYYLTANFVPRSYCVYFHQ